ncbi:TIGR03752 family integrating conjugative element protein [Alicycliphilus denitrificans]|uniref:TIGR03752 family integrating conjugative element protein n=1 Tax=Alicycliphilus denitrificans TaxID=179636 RepID=UPI00385054B8
MAVSRNKLIPVLGIGVLVMVGAIFTLHSSKPQAAKPMEAVPLPATAGADADTPAESLATVVASNRDLRSDVQQVLAENKRLREELARRGPMQSISAEPSDKPASGTGQQPNRPATPIDVLSGAWDNATGAFTGLGGTHPHAQAGAAAGNAAGSAYDASAGMVDYEVIPPMGYVKQTQNAQGKTTTRYVRAPGAAEVVPGATAAVNGSATRAAQAAAVARPEPFFTLPENSTLAGVTAMTSLIGRVPINGRVTDPMQFKAMVGRDNLAANGWELPEDLAGMVITGVAIGDMALSCTEGKVRSMTFVFNDGSITTVSARRAGSSSTVQSTGSNVDLGFISDLHGNPCIQGKFVTNAPAYLTDILGAKGLGVAAEALAQAQTTTLNRGDSTTSAVTGNAGSFALGRMGSAATDELTRWLTERLKNSFDAVVTPAGVQLVVHLDREVQIDKPVNARKIVHRTQATNILSGARYGLE